MADENQATDPNKAAAAQGASKDNLSEGQGTGGQPVLEPIQNKAPEKELTPEQKAAKEKADQEAADKKKAEEKPAEEKTEKKDDAKDYPVYNDEAADAVTAMLKEAGVTLEEADALFAKAVESKDMKDIDVEALTKKVGKEKAALIMIGVKDYYGRKFAGIQETVTAVHDVVGGKDNWTKVAEWARNKADKDPAFAKELDQYNVMFDTNKKAALAAVNELKVAYEKDPGNKSLNVKIVQGDGSASKLGGETLSRKDYLAKIKEAEDNRDFGEANRLRALRLASKQAGVR